MKTRLATVIGPESAVALACAMLRDVWSTVSALPQLRPILATIQPGPFPFAAGELWLQGDGDLGARIERILRRGLAAAPAAIAVGADSPLMAPARLLSAVHLLETHGAVIGPCRDGGFYLLGLRSCPRGLLAGIPWSCAETAAATRARLTEAGFSLAEIEADFDVDTPGDLDTLSAELQANPHLAPATRAWLLDRTALLRSAPC